MWRTLFFRFRRGRLWALKANMLKVVLRQCRVVSRGVVDGRVELDLLDGPLAGETHPGVVYPELGDIPTPGETVLANTAGIEMGLGTGGLAFVLPTAGGESPTNNDHFMKLPYTPLQFPVSQSQQATTLEDVPVVVLPLHSHLAPACCAVADLRPGARVALVWQEGGALPVGVSRICQELKELGLLHAVVSCGSCFGGDLESANVYSGLLTAAAVADVVLVGIGPGVVGTSTSHAHGGMSAAISANASVSLGAEPVFAPRVSNADARARHQGISHHTLAALEATLVGCRIALPNGIEQPSGVSSRHSFIPMDRDARGLEERFGVVFRSMGRLYNEDPVFFDAAAAAVALCLEERA